MQGGGGGGQGVWTPPPPGKSQVIWISIGCKQKMSFPEYIEDVYFFEVNTEYISLSVENIRIFMSAQHE